MKEKITIITSADLGTKENYKTRAIRPLIEKLKKENLSEQVIYKGGKTKEINMVCALGSIQRKIAPLGKIFFGKMRGNFLEENLLDLNASFKLKNNSTPILFHPMRFPRVYRKAKKQNRLIISIAVESHPTIEKTMREREAAKFNIKSPHFRLNYDNLEIIENSDYIIALSDFVKQTYIKAGIPEEKIYIANLDVDTNFFKPLSEFNRNNNFRVFYPATSTTLLRGLVYLLDAWHKTDISNSELRLAGNVYGESKEFNELLAKKMKNSSCIKVLGHLSKSDMLNEYQKSDVVVLPSINEGFPKTGIEAMSCGKPLIVTTNVPSLVEHKKSGFIVPICDVDSIKDYLLITYHNPEEVKQIGQKARETVLQKNSFADQILNIFDKIN